jgi:hypothetical protein
LIQLGADALFEQFWAEIKHLFESTGASFELITPQSAVFGCLVKAYIRTDASTWSFIMEKAEANLNVTPLIYQLWIEDASMYIRIGQHIWQSTRQDRQGGSRVLSTECGTPLANFGGLQLIQVLHHPYAPFQHDMGPLTPYQNVALLLGSTFRVGPRDITAVLSWLLHLRWSFPERLPIHNDPVHDGVATILNSISSTGA